VEPVATNSLISSNDHIVSLSDVEEKPIGTVGFDRNEIRCNDSKVVAVKANLVPVVCRSINQS
jgi:hypothetical protein